MSHLDLTESPQLVNLKGRPLCPTPARVCPYLIQGHCCHVEGDGRRCPNPPSSPVSARQMPAIPVQVSTILLGWVKSAEQAKCSCSL